VLLGRVFKLEDGLGTSWALRGWAGLWLDLERRGLATSGLLLAWHRARLTTDLELVRTRGIRLFN